ncbi:hypothetical protein [Sphingobacterium cellulitidis]|uniref:hypothetical protein n=1 Tax=Sphingobacterium cellulitidis TaxID=1768011 RepID=UPI003C7D9943
MFRDELSYDMEIDGFKIADIPADGGLATAFTSPGKVHEDTIEITQADPTENAFYAQGESTPLETSLKAGLRTGVANLIKVTAEVGADLLGGTVVAGQYHAPSGTPNIEKAIQIIDGKGMPYTYPRCRINAKVIGRFRVGEPNHIELRWTVLQPKKAGIAPEIIGVLDAG